MTTEQPPDLTPASPRWTRRSALGWCLDGALTITAALTAETTRVAVVLLVTTAIAVTLSAVSGSAGALRFRRLGEPRSWQRALVSIAGSLVALMALSGWQLAQWNGFLATGLQVVNGGSIAVALWALIPSAAKPLQRTTG